MIRSSAFIDSCGLGQMGTKPPHCSSTSFVRCGMSHYFVKISATLRLLTFPNLDKTVNEILGHGETNKTGARTMGGFCAHLAESTRWAQIYPIVRAPLLFVVACPVGSSKSHLCEINTFLLWADEILGHATTNKTGARTMGCLCDHRR